MRLVIFQSLIVALRTAKDTKTEYSQAIIDESEALKGCQTFQVGKGEIAEPAEYKVSETCMLQNCGSMCVGDRCAADVNQVCLQIGNPLPEAKTVTVYFLRHAESEWNSVTDKSLATKMRLEYKKGLVDEYMYLTDAHLSEEGLEGAIKAREDLETECPSVDQEEICAARKFLSGKNEAATNKAVFAVSNLRRAVMTALTVFKNRILPANAETVSQYALIEKMYVLSHLQEITKNTDSTPVTKRYNIPWLTFGTSEESTSTDKASQSILSQDEPLAVEGTCPFKVDQMKKFFVLQCETKDENENLREGSGDKKARLDKFCKWARDMVSRDSDLDTFVLTGHSIWIREFFREYLEDNRWGITKAWHFVAGATDIGQRLTSDSTKLSNQGIVKFQLKLFPDQLSNNSEKKSKKAVSKNCQIVHGSTKLVLGKIKGRLG